MAKQKKHLTGISPQDKGPAVNITETTIIPEVQERVSIPGTRRSISGIQQDEIVTVRNKINGAVNTMAAIYAVKLVTKDADTYEILK
jgi:hypothetical protein